MSSRRREKPRSSEQRGALRTTREGALLDEVRTRLSGAREMPTRLRRLERMERAARVWVNGRELAHDPRFGHLAENYD
jgi:hypothetical protein